jgi:hypothetical protein
MARIDSITAEFDLEMEWKAQERIHLRVWNDSLPGEWISSSVPDGALRYLRGVELGGFMSFLFDVEANRTCPESSCVEIEVDVSRLSVLHSPVSVGSYRWEGMNCRQRDSWGNTRYIALDTTRNENFVMFDSLPRSFEAILCCAEDASFRRHSGFSIYHIENSLIENLEEGHFARGGSTITMQLAKNLFLENTKVLSRKLEEVFLTWRLETYLSKNRIIELYANVVEWGPDVFGIREAAFYYFGVPPDSLSVREVAFLVSVLPGPRLYHRFYERGVVPGYWSAYLDRLIRISRDRGWLEDSAAEKALSDTLIFRRTAASRDVDRTRAVAYLLR